MNRPQAYTAGAYSAQTDAAILDNVADALRAGLVLARHGFAPIVPHAAIGHRVGWAEAMGRCRLLIASLAPERGDILVVLPGWEMSPGARQEVDLANALGIPVRTFDEVTR